VPAAPVTYMTRLAAREDAIYRGATRTRGTASTVPGSSASRHWHWS